MTTPTPTLRRRRLAGAAAAVAVISTLGGCGAETTVGTAPAGPATSAASPASTPGTLAGFCSTILALDTAGAQMDASPADDPTPTATPAFTESSMAPQDGDEPTPAATSDSSTSAPSTPTADPDADAVDSGSFVYGSDADGADATGGDVSIDTSPSTDDIAPAEPTAAPTPMNVPSAQELAAAQAVYPPLIAELERNRQAEVGPEVDTMVRLARQALATGDFDIFDSPEFNAADAKVDSFMLAKCGYEHLSVTASDFEFTGVPATAKAGPTGVTITNEGDEMHVATFLRFNDGVTTTVEDLLKLPEPEAKKLTTTVGESFALPGKAGTAFFDLKPGRYAVICPIPKGSKDGHIGDGAPHFTEGMFIDLTVQ